MIAKYSTFRVGRVQGFLRNKVWYLCYHEAGCRHRPRVGTDKNAARQMAAQINAQLEVGAPAALSFEPVSLTDLQQRWLDHHEHVLRSSVHTVNRYRTATAHLLRFIQSSRPTQSSSNFSVRHAEEFVRHLRTIEVAPNGHQNAKKRPLLDKGIKFILETCRAMFTFALKRRHLSPYAENPFTALDLDKIPVENSKPIRLFERDEEHAFLLACDDWQFPIFATLLLTGLRPGEMPHLLLPNDLDLEQRTLYVRNKPNLGWQVKTRNEREIPLVAPLICVLREMIGDRTTGPVFLRRRFSRCQSPLLKSMTATELSRELDRRVEEARIEQAKLIERSDRLTIARCVWCDAGAIKEDRIRREFMRVTRSIGLSDFTSPKLLRHMFATHLQDANVDPLIRNELMGHSPGSANGGRSLGMTAVYTHTRPHTRRQQLEAALANCPAFQLAVTRQIETVSQHEKQ